MKRPGFQWDARKLKPKQCVVCDAEFQPTIGFQKYCSPSCRHRAYLEEYECQHCGLAFIRERSAGKNKYCSSRCSNTATAPGRGGKGRFGQGSIASYPKPARCVGCNASYMQNRPSMKYCTRSCHMKHRHAEARKTAEPKWGITAKGEPNCRNCGAQASHLHHVVPRSKSRLGREEIFKNGIPLCFPCHRGWHDRRVTIYRDRLTEDELEFVQTLVGPIWMDRNYPVAPVHLTSNSSLEDQTLVTAEDGLESAYRTMVGNGPVGMVLL